MRNLVVLTKMIEESALLTRLCAEEMLYGNIDFTDNIASTLAMLSILGSEYKVDNPTIIAKNTKEIGRLAAEINELLPKSHEELDDDDQSELSPDTPDQTDTQDQPQTG